MTKHWCPLGNSKAVSCKVFTIKRTESAEDRAGSHTPKALEFFREQGAASPRGLAWRTPRVGPSPVLFLFGTGVAGSCNPTVRCRKEQDTQHQAGSSAQPAAGQGQSLPGQVIPARALWMIQQPEGCRALQCLARGTPRTGTSSR